MGMCCWVLTGPAHVRLRPVGQVVLDVDHGMCMCDLDVSGNEVLDIGKGELERFRPVWAHAVLARSLRMWYVQTRGALWSG